MPRCTNSIPHFPTLFLISNSDDVPDDLMSGNARESVIESSGPNKLVRVADTICKYFE